MVELQSHSRLAAMPPCGDEGALATVALADHSAHLRGNATSRRLVRRFRFLLARRFDCCVLLLLESGYESKKSLLDDLRRVRPWQDVTQEFLRRADRVVSFLADRAAQLEARGR